ncbi:citrate transporter [Ruegeria sp. HKCCD4884]|uniref:CitMHS family transporter n=1 Tax=Ruegeria sp. HKCCD4884 TaxID=2683022 RepID=UPI001492B8D1|nr:citrate:proton symporter [Ruegeria sp. HKCCD4884]NOD95084.1 citrate transporter [Ruegeria sp. HKCCD4884]
MALIGLATIVLVVVSLLTGRVTPVIALILFPLAGALLAGFGPTDLSEFFNSGLLRVAPVATMFIFAILFFGILQDTGLFRPIINWIIGVTKGNAVAITVATAMVGALAHLDGAGATTFLLTVPALLPLYVGLGMNRYLMLMMLCLGAGLANMLPWAGPLGRASAVSGIDLTVLWHPLIPIQIVGLVLLAGFAVLMGLREKRIMSKTTGDENPTGSMAQYALKVTDEELALERPQLIFVNGGLFLATVVALVLGLLPPAFLFMISLSLLLLINYRDVDSQINRMKAHAPSALTMATIIFAAGAFLGLMDGTGMLRVMAEQLVEILPESVVPTLHIWVGLIGAPLELVLSTDAFYFGLMPVMLEIVEPTGVPTESIVYAMLIGNIIGTFISPFSPALWLALGLAGASMGRHIRYSLLPLWLFSIAVFGVGFLLGLY